MSKEIFIYRAMLWCRSSCGWHIHGDISAVSLKVHSLMVYLEASENSHIHILRAFRELLTASLNCLSVSSTDLHLPWVCSVSKTPTSKFQTYNSTQELLHANCTSCTLQLCSLQARGCHRCNSPSKFDLNEAVLCWNGGANTDLPPEPSYEY